MRVGILDTAGACVPGTPVVLALPLSLSKEILLVRPVFFVSQKGGRFSIAAPGWVMDSSTVLRARLFRSTNAPLMCNPVDLLLRDFAALFHDE